MKRILPLLFCVTGAIWLLPPELVEPAGEASAQEAAKKAAERKAAPPAPQKAAAPAVRKPISPALPAPPRADDDAVAQQIEQQFVGPLRQIYKAELHFMRVVCQPTRQQYEKVVAESEVESKAAIKKFAQNWQGMQEGRMAINSQSDPRTAMADTIAKAVRATLPPEKAEEYKRELDQRTAARKQATVINLVAKIDKILVLTVEQRDKLREILANNWHDSWGETQMLQNIGRYFPQMPDAKIDPILTDNQKTVWRGVHKGVRFGFHPGMLQGIDIEEEVWDDDRDAAKPEPAIGKAAIKKVEKK